MKSLEAGQLRMIMEAYAGGDPISHLYLVLGPVDSTTWRITFASGKIVYSYGEQLQNHWLIAEAEEER